MVAQMTVNSILTAYLITANLKALGKRLVDQQMRFVMIRIEFIFSRFKSTPLGASGEVFRNQTKREKSLIFLGGLVSCDANTTSSELPLPKIVYYILLTSYALEHGDLNIIDKHWYFWVLKHSSSELI